MNNAVETLAGLNGGLVVSGTSANAGNWYAIKAITDVVLSSVTLDGGFSGSGLNGATINAGDVLIIRASSVTLTSGTAVLYSCT